ncbi:MAG TPA: hypothetical protein VF329_07490 [Gammaproteobacteria bacterium]
MSDTFFAALVAAGAAAMLGGCTAGGLFVRDEPGTTDAEQSEDVFLDGEGLSVYLEVMRQLVEGDPVTQAETFLEVAEAAAAAPTTTNRLKLALALATPDHPSSDPAEARRMLSELLASGAALLPEERMLVAIHLKEVEERLILDAEAEQLRVAAAEAREAEDVENGRRLEAALEENERLRKQLQEAQQKLDAITNIERSIRERENGTDSQ